MKKANWILSVAPGLTLSAAVSVAGDAAIVTPAQVIQQVRAQEAAGAQATAIGPGFAKVPAPSAAAPESADAPVAAPARRTPTVQDKLRLEAQLRFVNSALKIHQVTDTNTQRASEAIAARGQMLYTYTPGGIYEVQTATFHETALELQPGETLTGKDLPTAGDTARWTIAATRTGSPPNEITVLIVKPLEAGLETNMTVTTNRRLYTVILKSNQHTYMPLVGWLYPQDEARALEEKATIAKETEAQSEPIAVLPEALNFNCTISGAQVAWRPLRVYDDGSKTYLQMSPDMHSSEAPAIFVMEKKTPILVNFRVKHSIYIVDRLFDRAELRVGPKTAVDVSCVHHLASR
jgi:P-type conjugative transfer protein TrbG